MKNKDGFTLIELMIVISIIAVISSIAIPSLLDARRRGNESAALATTKGFLGGIMQYSLSTEEQYFWKNSRTDFGLFFSHVSPKAGYNYYYFSNSEVLSANDADDATAFIYLAVPIAFNSGRKLFAVDETGTIYTLDLTTTDFSNAAIPDGLTAINWNGTWDTSGAVSTWTKIDDSALQNNWYKK